MGLPHPSGRQHRYTRARASVQNSRLTQSPSVMADGAPDAPRLSCGRGETAGSCRQARFTLVVAHARDRGRNTSLFIASPGEMWTAASDAIHRFCRCACMRSAGKPRTRTTSPRSARHSLPLALPLPLLPPLPLPPLASAAELRQFTIYDLRPHRRRSTRSRSTATSMRRSGCTGACSTSVRSSGQACRQVQSNGELQRPMQT